MRAFLCSYLKLVSLRSLNQDEKIMTSLLATSDTRANYFKVTRQQHLTETAEDYTELVADLAEVQEEVRVRDLAKLLGISHVTVIRTVQKLTRDGYLDKKEQNITLTPKGKRLAKTSKQRHQTLLEFWDMLGVGHNVAQAEVEGVEHHISSTTLKAMQVHMARWKSLNKKE